MERGKNNMKTAPQKATEYAASHLTYNRVRESTRWDIKQGEDYYRTIHVYNFLINIHFFPVITDVFDGVSGEIR
jgi:hypothetical protein